MAKITIDDLPQATGISQTELKGVFGGSRQASEFASLGIRSRVNDIDAFLVEKTNPADANEFPWDFNTEV